MPLSISVFHLFLQIHKIQHRMRLLFTTFLIALFFSSCSWFGKGGKGEGQDTGEIATTKIIAKKGNEFSADTAFHFIQKQLEFGFRVPGMASHKKCADWLFSMLKKYCDTVYYQKGSAETWDKKKIPVYNLIGEFNPASAERILLAAHWDSRPIADQDADESKRNQPIQAANDGASGVAVLLEIARNLKKNKPKTGIDIVFFDAEDLGNPGANNPDSYCLGSQYWGNNLHRSGYTANFGVLLDMVGAKDATFFWEGISYNNAPEVLEQTWSIAEELGFGNYFIRQQAQAITDDHNYVYKHTKIPMIDIIHLDLKNANSIFGDYWHTHKDNIEIIDKATLNAVGTVVSSLIFNPPKSMM